MGPWAGHLLYLGRSHPHSAGDCGGGVRDEHAGWPQGLTDAVRDDQQRCAKQSDVPAPLYIARHGRTPATRHLPHHHRSGRAEKRELHRTENDQRVSGGSGGGIALHKHAAGADLSGCT